MKKVKVRFLVQGILTIPAEQMPEGWDKWSARDKWDWTMEWWDEHVGESLLRESVLMDDIPGDPAPGLLEVFDGEEYVTIAQSNEYHGWFNCEQPSAIYEGED